MDDAVLADYIKRRLDSGDTLSEIKLSLMKAGYSNEQLQSAISHEKEEEKPVALNSKALSKPWTKKLSKFIGVYSKVLYGIIALIAIWLVISKMTTMTFDTSELKINFIVGTIYVIVMVILSIIMGILIFSVHKATRAHTVNQLYFTKNLVAIILGQVFTGLFVISLSTIPVYIPVIIGSFVFALLMLYFVGSTSHEVVASFATFFALTVFYYMLINQVYTKEVIVTVLNLI